MAAQLQAKNLELALHAQTLEAEIVERRRTEQALNQAKEAAEAANRAKSAFLATMSHELRTPLTAIIGFTELMQLMTTEQNYQHFPEYLATVLRASHHLLNLINDVLDLTRIEAGRLSVLAEAIAINELLAEVVATVEPLMAANRNVLHAELNADLGTLVSDPTRLRQVLLNVLGNAAKFTEDGTVRLSVERDASWVRFIVADTGIGISEDQLGQLFTPFSQGDTSLNRKYEGSGLGLALSRRLCRQLGGEVMVQSEPGVGSRFTILLPAQAPNAPDSASMMAADAHRSEADLADATRSEMVAHDAAVVLVIASNDEVCAGLVRGLRAQRLTVLTAETADASLRIARDIEPEVIVVAPLGVQLDERVLLSLFADRAEGRASAIIVLASQVDPGPASARLQAAGAQIVPTEALALDAVLRCLAA